MRPIVIDNFLPDPHCDRERALQASFETVVHHGITYRGIAMTDDSLARDKIRAALRIPEDGSWTVFWRRYLASEENETYIHADALMGQVTGVLFLNEPAQCYGGVAFWRHRLYGWSHVPPAEELPKRGLEDTPEFWNSVIADGQDHRKWEMTDYVPMAFNRLVIFWSPMFHSRYPRRSFGHLTHDARLVKCFFFNPEGVPRGTDS
jgi:hypothetical protein